MKENVPKRKRNDTPQTTERQKRLKNGRMSKVKLERERQGGSHYKHIESQVINTV